MVDIYINRFQRQSWRQYTCIMEKKKLTIDRTTDRQQHRKRLQLCSWTGLIAGCWKANKRAQEFLMRNKHLAVFFFSSKRNRIVDSCKRRIFVGISALKAALRLLLRATTFKTSEYIIENKMKKKKNNVILPTGIFCAMITHPMAVNVVQKRMEYDFNE